MDLSLLEYVPDGVIVVDRDGGRIVHVNRNAEELFGYRSGELLGQPVEVLVPGSLRAQHRAHVEAYDSAPRRGTMRSGVELSGRRKDGSEFPAEITLSPFSEGGRGYAMAAVRDVSERKTLERTAALLRVKEMALQERNSFLSVAAHELRTPVAALQLRLDLLHRAAERSEAVLPSIHLANMEELERLTRRITLVVNSIVDVAQMRGGAAALSLEEVDLAAAARQVISRLRSEIESSGSEVVLAAPMPVLGRWDRARVDQVLTNLLVNALKFGEGNAIRVTVNGDNDRARLSVTDGGAGIRPEDQSRIFGPFETGAPGEKPSGLGLGLYLCGQIMNAHAGTIEVQSTPGGGSTFTVEFPRGTAVN